MLALAKPAKQRAAKTHAALPDLIPARPYQLPEAWAQ